MSVELSIHATTKVRVQANTKPADNWVTLYIEHGDGQESEVTLFFGRTASERDMVLHALANPEMRP